MHPSLRTVESFEELLKRQRDDTPYDYQTLFSNEGFLARRASKKRLKLLKRLDETIRAMLHPSERVQFLTAGVAFAFWEAYFLGIPMYLLNRRALVLTSERVLLIQINSRQRPKDLRAQIARGAIEAFGRSGLGNTRLRLRSGKKLVLAYIPRRDRTALTTLLGPLPQRAGPATDIENLCPHCYVPQAGFPAVCSACGGGFKSARKAGLLSLLFPGLGDLYLGHWPFAILEIGVAGLIWLGVLIPDPSVPTTLPERLIIAGLVFVFVHVTDAVATRYVARKGLYPLGERPRTVGAAA